MTFFGAIRSAFSKYATFTGRSSRSEFWWWILFEWFTRSLLGFIYTMTMLAMIVPTAAALQLWQRPWAAMVGMPSRLTAAATERRDRARMLTQALQQHAISGYSGIRISSGGRRFQIDNARLWTLWDDQGRPSGQAAAFNRWWWL